jgi:Domain of unknown function (DUF5658)
MELGAAIRDRDGAGKSRWNRRLMVQATFIMLQVLDVATTMIAIHMGGTEQNVLVARFLLIGTLQGLILSKVLLLTIATIAVLARKDRALAWANFAFGAIVLWNVSVIVRLALRARGI